MSQHQCPICSHDGKKNAGTSLEKVFQGSGKEVKLPLCYNHSVEFFKNGQRLFLAKYERNLSRYSLETNPVLTHFKNPRKIQFS